MKAEEREKYIEEFLKKCKEIRDSKGASYARATDVNANFKRVAVDLKRHPLEVWAVYFHKHTDAIFGYIQGIEESEPIEERIADAVNYLLILLTLILEGCGLPKIPRNSQEFLELTKNDKA